MYRARRDVRVHTRRTRVHAYTRHRRSYRCTFHERMRRLVYLANAIAELFICLLPGSASRECLYIRANTPRESYARGSPSFFSVQGLPGYVAVGHTIGSLLSFLRYVRLSIFTFVSVTSVSPFLFPSPLSLSFSLGPFRRDHYTISREKKKKKENRKSTKKNDREVNKVGIRTIPRNLP